MNVRFMSTVASLSRSGTSAAKFTGTVAPACLLTVSPNPLIAYTRRKPPGQRPAFPVSRLNVYSALPQKSPTLSLPQLMTPCGIVSRSASKTMPFLSNSSRSPPSYQSAVGVTRNHRRRWVEPRPAAPRRCPPPSAPPAPPGKRRPRLRARLSPSLPASGREPDGERCALALDARTPDLPTQLIDEPLRDREAVPVRGFARRRHGAQAHARHEEPLLVLGAQAGAFVSHATCSAVAIGIHVNPNTLVGWRILDGVGQEIVADGLDDDRIDAARRDIVDRPEIDLDPLQRGRASVIQADAVREAPEVDVVQPHPILGPRGVVHQPGHRVGHQGGRVGEALKPGDDLTV